MWSSGALCNAAWLRLARRSESAIRHISPSAPFVLVSHETSLDKLIHLIS